MAQRRHALGRRWIPDLDSAVGGTRRDELFGSSLGPEFLGLDIV